MIVNPIVKPIEHYFAARAYLSSSHFIAFWKLVSEFKIMEQHNSIKIQVKALFQNFECNGNLSSEKFF